MAKASDNKFPKVILEERLSDGSDTSNPAADHRALYLGEDGLLHLRDSAGGITGVGGAETLPVTIIDAKGDIIAGTAADTAARVAVGANGTKLVADSAATPGVKWEGFVGVRAIANAVTSLTTATWTSIALAGADRFDTSAFHDPASNNTRLTVPSGQDGTYMIGGNLQIAGNVTGQRGCRIFLNNATRIADDIRNAISDVTLPSARFFPVTLYALVATDYVEIQAWQNSGVSINTENTANSTAEFWMYKVG